MDELLNEPFFLFYTFAFRLFFFACLETEGIAFLLLFSLFFFRLSFFARFLFFYFLNNRASTVHQCSFTTH